MWISIVELDPAHIIPAKILGSIWRGAYFSPIAPLQVQNLPRRPLPASDWVRVRNLLAGICGSDLRLIFDGGDFRIAPAAVFNHRRIYPGHEVAGEVIEVGDDVERLHVGDRVVLQYAPNCLTAGVELPCRACAAGNYNLCEHGPFSGPEPVGGGWSEEMLLHEQQLFRISPTLSDAQAVLLEPSAVAIHAVLRRLPEPGERVLIIGAGTIGQLILQVVRALVRDADISVMARHPFQIERAARLGATIIYPQDSYKEIEQATGAQLYEGMLGNKMLLGGYDVIFDTIGSQQTTHHALRWARAGATVVMVGTHPSKMHIDLSPIWYQEISLVGSTGHGIETWPAGSSERKSTFEVAAEMIERGQIVPEKLITHRFPLSEFRNALITALDKSRHRAIKVVFDYSLQPPSVVPNVRASARPRRQAATPPAPLEAETEEETSTILPTEEDEDVKTIVVSPSELIHRYKGAAPPAQQHPETSEPASPQDQDDRDQYEDTLPAMKAASEMPATNDSDQTLVEVEELPATQEEEGDSETGLY